MQARSAASCRIAQRVATLLLVASHHRYIVEMAFRAPLVAVNAPCKKPKARNLRQIPDGRRRQQTAGAREEISGEEPRRGRHRGISCRAGWLPAAPGGLAGAWRSLHAAGAT